MLLNRILNLEELSHLILSTRESYKESKFYIKVSVLDFADWNIYDSSFIIQCSKLIEKGCKYGNCIVAICVYDEVAQVLNCIKGIHYVCKYDDLYKTLKEIRPDTYCSFLPKVGNLDGICRELKINNKT